MERALALFTASATLLSLGSAGCAARSTPPRDASAAPSEQPPRPAHLLLAAAAATPAARYAPPPTAAPASATTTTEPAMTELPPRVDHSSTPLPRAFGWLSIGVGTVATGAAVATSFMMLHQNSLRNDECAQKVCSQSGLNANSQLGALAPWNVGLWTVAVAGLGVGAILLVTHPADSAKQTALVVAPTGSGAAVSLWSAF